MADTNVSIGGSGRNPDALSTTGEGYPYVNMDPNNIQGESPYKGWTAEGSIKYLEKLWLANSEDDANQTARQILGELSYDQFKEAYIKKYGNASDAIISQNWDAMVAGIASDPNYARYGDPTVSDTTSNTTSSTSGSGASQIDYADLMRLQEEIGGRAAAYNRELAAELTGEVRGQTLETASALDEALQREMDRLYPGLRRTTMATSQEALEATRRAAAEFSTGMVPQDVQDYQRKLAAELGIQRGVFGSARDYGLARNLGLTSLQMKQQGIAMYGTLPSMSAQILQNARSMSPAMNNLPQMYDAMYARQFAASAMDTGALTTNIGDIMAKNAELAQDQYQFGLQLDWAKKLSDLQLQMDRERLAAQQKYWDDAVAAQKYGSTLGAISNIGAAALGRNWGSNAQTPDDTGTNNTLAPTYYGGSSWFNQNSNVGGYSGYSGYNNTSTSTMFPGYSSAYNNLASQDSSAGGLTSDDYTDLWYLDQSTEDDEDDR